MRAAVVAFVCVMALSTAARAQTASELDQRARLHFQSGSSYFDVGEYENALREFEQAYRLSNRAALLYNIGLTHERLGNLREAADALRRYVAETDPPERETLELRIRNIEERAARQASEGDTEPVDGGSGEDTVVPPGPNGPTVVDAEPSGGLPTPALVSFIAGGVGLATFGIFGALALSEDGSLEDSCADACTDDQVSSLRTYNTIADIGLGVAVVGAALGVIFLVTSGGDDAPSDGAASVAPWATASAAGVAAGGTF